MCQLSLNLYELNAIPSIILSKFFVNTEKNYPKSYIQRQRLRKTILENNTVEGIS